ncbi:MAG: GNAT family N-acetyltransferase [Anaerolineae bacterium]|jgi:GNAT superfamily N-acetyltransferase
MNEVLADSSAASLTAAIKANMLKYFRYLSSSPSTELFDSPKLTWFITGVPHPFMNGIFRTQLTPDDADDEIRRTLASFKARQVPFMWWVGSATQPADLGRRLEAHGLAYCEDTPGMAADLLALREDSASPAGLTIQTVGDEDTLAQWVSAAVIGFEMPETGEDPCFDLFAGVGFDLPLRNYLGLLGGKPVAASQLFLAAGVAGIYYVATVPEARRHGIGTAMTLASLREARAMGYRIGILQSSEMGLRVYGRLGFEEYCTLRYGIWMGAS